MRCKHPGGPIHQQSIEREGDWQCIGYAQLAVQPCSDNACEVPCSLQWHACNSMHTAQQLVEHLRGKCMPATSSHVALNTSTIEHVTIHGVTTHAIVLIWLLAAGITSTQASFSTKQHVGLWVLPCAGCCGQETIQTNPSVMIWEHNTSQATPPQYSCHTPKTFLRHGGGKHGEQQEVCCVAALMHATGVVHVLVKVGPKASHVMCD